MTVTATKDNGENQQILPFPPQKVKNYPTFLPEQPHQIGSLLPSERFPQNASPPKIFEPITIRGVEFPNKLWIAPMCQYSADNGAPTDHHLVHLGSMAMRGWGSIMFEATSVVPEGRISPEDCGLWEDSQIASYKRVVDYVHALKGVIGIQIAHAGRKASTAAPWNSRLAMKNGWKGGSTVAKENNGWSDNVIGPSAISFKDGDYPDPIEASAEYLESIKKAYADCVERCEKIGFDFIEIHGAHGYFIHEFTDPISNQRTDQYGGSLENRIRLPLELAKIVREKWNKPLFYRLSASDWLDDALGPEKGHQGEKEEYSWWGIEQTTILTQKLADLGVDVIDVSSGGNDLRQKVKVGPSYQLPFAEHIKKHVKNILVGTVGIITDPKQANDILENDKADIIFIGRQALREVDFPLRAALELGAAVAPAIQYERAWDRMVVKRDHPHKAANAKGITEAQGEETAKATSEIHSSIP